MATRIMVRPLLAEDYRAIRNIEKAIDTEYLRFLSWTGEKDTVTPSVTPAYLRHYLKAGCSFVAEVADEVIGYILAQPTSYVYGRRKALWLEYIAVLPGHRRQRIGSRLLDSVVGWARKNHYEALYTTLNPNNRESANLLAKNRFLMWKWMVAERTLLPSPLPCSLFPVE